MTKPRDRRPPRPTPPPRPPREAMATPRQREWLYRELNRRLTALAERVARAQQKAPGLAAGGSAWNDADED